MTTKWLTLTKLAAEFGYPVLEFGSLLKDLGLRQANGQPSDYAKTNYFVKSVKKIYGVPFYIWSFKKTTEYLVNKGIRPENSVAVQKAELLANKYLEALKLEEQSQAKASRAKAARLI